MRPLAPRINMVQQIPQTSHCENSRDPSEERKLRELRELQREYERENHRQKDCLYCRDMSRLPMRSTHCPRFGVAVISQRQLGRLYQERVARKRKEKLKRDEIRLWSSGRVAISRGGDLGVR